METINIQGVPETMLQTLYARAAYSKKKNHKFYDEKSMEIVSRIDYDFTNAAKDSTMSDGVIARTILLDRMVGDFIKENPETTVINIACGMDTRVYRVDNGKVHWYNIDLPETIAVRERFLNESDRICMIAKSAMDESWAEVVGKQKGKVLVIIEGLTMYLTEADVKQILEIVDKHFDDVEVIMETMNPFVVKHVKEKSIEASRAKFSWGISSGKEVEKIAPSFQWIKDVSLTEGMKVMYPAYGLIGWIPAVQNIANRLVVLRKGM